MKKTLYIVPVSGGKDSQCVLSLAVKKYGAENVLGVHHYTGIDHSLTYAHIDWMKGFYGVAIEFTTNRRYESMWDLMDKRNAIPNRISRFCTDEFKIQAFNQWLDGRKDLDQLVVLMGMRTAESQARSVRYDSISPDDVFSLRDLNRRKIRARFECVRVQLPIVDRTTGWVYEYLRTAGEKLNPLYARGHRRVGCYPCILAGKHDYRLAARDPEGRETVIKLRDFKEMITIAKGVEHTVVIPHDLDAILAEQDFDPFGLFDEEDDNSGGCQFCAD